MDVVKSVHCLHCQYCLVILVTAVTTVPNHTVRCNREAVYVTMSWGGDSFIALCPGFPPWILSCSFGEFGVGILVMRLVVSNHDSAWSESVDSSN